MLPAVVVLSGVFLYVVSLAVVVRALVVRVLVVRAVEVRGVMFRGSNLSRCRCVEVCRCWGLEVLTMFGAVERSRGQRSIGQVVERLSG